MAVGECQQLSPWVWDYAHGTGEEGCTCYKFPRCAIIVLSNGVERKQRMFLSLIGEILLLTLCSDGKC